MIALSRRKALAWISAIPLAAAALPSAAAKPGKKFNIYDAPKPMEDVPFVYGGGKPGTLSDFRGKYVLLNIWATWCVPCRVEMPALDRLQGELGGDNFEVVPLSIDRAGEPAVRAFYDEIGIKNLRIFLDQKSKVMRSLGIFGLPTTFLVNPNGWEAGALVGPAEWDMPEMIELFRRHVISGTSENSSRRN